MSAPNWNELKADGRVVFDHPGRKLAIYSSPGGAVVFLSVEDGKGTYSTLEPHEFEAFTKALVRAGQEAKVASNEIAVEVETFLALERIKGGQL